MERVAFLVEESGERIRCLLNPETLVVRRLAGVQTRRAAGGLLTGAQLTDNPLLFTGGGTTELQLDLLFDVSLAGSSINSDNVRDLTRPLWNLAENTGAGELARRPPQVRFLWGKFWDIPGVVVAVAERLEYFAASGAPGRSWLRLRLLRVNEALPGPAARLPALPSTGAITAPSARPGAPNLRLHAIAGGIVPAPQRIRLGALPGRPAFELSLLEASLTAGGIIMAALAETQTAAALARALQGVGALVTAAVQEIGERTQAMIAAIGDSPAVRALREGAEAAGAAVAGALSALAEEMQAAFVFAATTVSAVATEARERLGRLAVEVQAAVAERVAAVSAELRPVASALREAAVTMATAVRGAVEALADTPAARAFVGATRRLVGAVEAFIQADSPVLDSLQALAATVGHAFDEIGQGAAALGREAAQQVSEALQEIAPLVAEIRAASSNVAAFVAGVALEPLQAAFADVGSVAGAFVEAAGVVAPAARARAAHVISAGARYLQVALNDVESLLQPGMAAATTAGSVAAQEAAAGAVAVATETGELLQQLVGEGRLAGAQMLRSLAGFGAASEALWLAGAGRRQRRLQTSVQGAVLAAKQIDAGGEALDSVSFATARAPADHWAQRLAQGLEAPAEEADATDATVTDDDAGDAAADGVDHIDEASVPPDPDDTWVPGMALEPEEMEETAAADASAASITTTDAPEVPAAALVTAVAALRPATGVQAGERLSAAAAQLQAQVEDMPRKTREAAAADARAALHELGQALDAAAAAGREAVTAQVVDAISAFDAPAADFSTAEIVSAATPQATQRPQAGERLDQIAYQAYGNPAGWRLLALANDIDHPLQLAAGRMLQIPPLNEP